MIPDQLINGLIQHVNADELIEARRNGSTIYYFAELARKICGTNVAPTPTIRFDNRPNNTPTIREEARPQQVQPVRIANDGVRVGVL